MENQSLKDKTVKGVTWNGISNIISTGVSFLVGIVLARLLSPDDYGLIGIITIFTAICDTIINAGFSSALIRKKDAAEDDFCTVFIVNLSISLLLYFILFVSAPLIAKFFEREELVSLTRVATISLIIGALAIVQNTRLTKQIDFKTQAIITLSTYLCSGITGIAMAFMGAGVWALVTQGLLAQLLRTILLWYYNKWIPKLRFSSTSFHELFGFGWKMMLSGLLNALWSDLTKVIVSKFYSPATLGQYTRSGQFASLLSGTLTSIIQRVTFPVLSNIQDNKERMVAAYRRIIRMTMFVTVPSMFFLGAISEPFIFCLIGSKWHDAATYLPLVCIYSTTYPLHAINLNMLMVQGRSDLFLGLEIVKKIIALGPLFVGAFIGIIPMLYANLISMIIAFFLNSYYSGKLLNYSSWNQIMDVAPFYGLAIIMAIPIYFIKFLPFTYWLILPVQLITGIVLFFLICESKKIEEYKEYKSIVSPFFKKILHK